MTIDGKEVEARRDMTILEAARAAGIRIPTLCHSEKVSAAGVCRLCMVEISNGKRKRLVASCVYPVTQGLTVRTNTKKVRKIRRMIIELLWPQTQALANEYGVTSSRFARRQTDCSLCGLCVRYCSEVKRANAVYFKGRGIDRKIAFSPDMQTECAVCRECFDLCPGGWIVTESGRAFLD